MDDEQAAFFSTNGYCVLPAVLRQPQLAELNALVDAHVAAGDCDPRSSVLSMRWNEHGTLPNGIADWGEAFRDLITHPRVAPVLRELLSKPCWKNVHPAATEEERALIRLDHDYLDRTMWAGGEGATANSYGTSRLHGNAEAAFHV